MRKKLLRSRSGFEKPESREEAIMQNILGASNVLEPSESNIEEILKSILYNTPYTKEAEFEIEKILLAIKNNGTYDGEHESRDLKILFAILNDLDYTEEAESRIEELFIEWLHQRSSIKVLEGIPPLTFTSLGQPLINYLIEGNTTQSGTPTPDSPIMPQGTGERTGNLFDYSAVTLGKYINANGEEVTSVGEGEAMLSHSDYISVLPNNSYTFKVTKIVNVSATTNAFCWFDDNKEIISRDLFDGEGSSDYIEATYTAPYGAVYLIVNYRGLHGDTGMVNSGSTALPYEPYGYKLTISSANTTTPVYLGEVETTRKIKKLVLTGTETWMLYNGNYYSSVTDGYSLQNTPCRCTHTAGGIIIGNGSVRLKVFASRFTAVASNLEEWKTYLQQQYQNGTPVTVWYVLATETTGIVNEPLMKIGSYADSISMEQTGIEIPTINGSNTFDVDTTVKPSNVYIEYK